jgi:outer membrane protein
MMLATIVALTPARAMAQAPASSVRPWALVTRLLVTGSSDRSDPPGYQAYSTFTLEAAVRRHLSRTLDTELSVRTESREIDSLFPAGENRRLGSIELLPIALLLHYRLPTRAAWHPYAGAGVNLTVAWEKSGLLDSVDMRARVGPAVQVGTDLDLSSAAVLNVDLKWNKMTATLENAGTRLARIRLDPVSLGVGVGFRF